MELEIRTKDGTLIGTFKNKCALLQFHILHQDRENFEFTFKIIKGKQIPVFVALNDVYLQIAGDIEIYVQTGAYIKVI